jgi:general secretion pathway protein N
MRRWLWPTLLGLLAFLIFALAQTPAQLLAAPARAAGVELLGLSGTLWRGEASTARAEGMDLGRVSWRLRPWALLGARLRAEVRLEGEAITGHGEISLRPGDGLRGQALRLSAPAELLTGLSPVPAELGGSLFARFESLHWTPDGALVLDGELTWTEAQTYAPAPMALGAFRVLFEPHEGGSQGLVSGEETPVNVGGRILLQPDGGYVTALRLSPRADTPNELREALALIARPERDGSVRLQLQGQLPPPPL